MTFESVEERKLFAADLRFAAESALSTSTARHAAEMDDIGAEVRHENHWFIENTFSFGIEREMKESGEKGGTEDINIGVGELQNTSSNLFVVDSFAFGIEREMKESGW